MQNIVIMVLTFKCVRPGDNPFAAPQLSGGMLCYPDIEIAQGCQMRPITEVAAAAGLDAEDLELYGKYKAKLSADVWKKAADKSGRQARSRHRH